MEERIKSAAEAVRNALGEAEIGLILGSGLANSISLENASSLPYEQIPSFPVSTAEGHVSEWVKGTLGGKSVFLLRGRFHLYEGYSLEDIVLPIRMMKRLNVKTLILTNAAGGVNLNFSPGDLMLITDSVNFSGVNPLIGKNLDSFGPRFPDLTNAFHPSLQAVARAAAKKLHIPLQEGVYMWFSGPSYETPAEIRAARVLGADAVGMSTVPEMIAARHCGLSVLGITCITNMAAGILEKPLSHEEVIQTSHAVTERFSMLISEIIKSI